MESGDARIVEKDKTSEASTFTLSNHAIEDYRRILQGRCKVDLTTEQAQSQAESLLRLYQAIFMPANTGRK